MSNISILAALLTNRQYRYCKLSDILLVLPVHIDKNLRPKYAVISLSNFTFRAVGIPEKYGKTKINTPSLRAGNHG